MILYADDSVLFVGGKTYDVIEEKLNSDLEQIANWLDQYNFVLNLSKTNTECVLYRTHQRTSGSKSMEVKINQTKITESDTYEYLAVKMNKTLTFSGNLEKTFIKASSRIKLLSRILIIPVLTQQKQFARTQCCQSCFIVTICFLTWHHQRRIFSRTPFSVLLSCLSLIQNYLNSTFYDISALQTGYRKFS